MRGGVSIRRANEGFIQAPQAAHLPAQTTFEFARQTEHRKAKMVEELPTQVDSANV